MGSWSESCGFSGLEIREGEIAYVMLLEDHKVKYSHGPHDFFQPSTTLLRGTYGDYGYLNVQDSDAMLDIFNAQAELKLEQGESFSSDQLEGREGVYRFWIHGSVVDSLGTLPVDFPFVWIDEKGVRVKDIQEYIEVSTEGRRSQFAAIRQEISNITMDPQFESDRLAKSRIEMILMRMRMNSGRRDKLNAWYDHDIHQCLRNNSDVEALLEAQNRNLLISMAAGELRKKITPSEGVGPQHNGEEASVAFAQTILKIQEQRHRERDEEDDDGE